MRAETAGVKYAVALSSCTAALHLCMKLAGEKLYGKPMISHGALEGKRVFCSDMTFDATLNPVVYEGGIPVFIDTEYATWNMDPVALEKAFEMYPDTRLVVCAELYGFSGDIRRIKEICQAHGALLVEDAAEAMGASWEGRNCGTFGDFAAISYNGNKIITGSSGGCLLTNDIEVANKARKLVHPGQRKRGLVPARGGGLQLPDVERHCRCHPGPVSLPLRAYRPEEGNLRALQGGAEGPPREDRTPSTRQNAFPTTGFPP